MHRQVYIAMLLMLIMLTAGFTISHLNRKDIEKAWKKLQKVYKS